MGDSVRLGLPAPSVKRRASPMACGTGISQAATSRSHTFLPCTKGLTLKRLLVLSLSEAAATAPAAAARTITISMASADSEGS
jgi:hypothetical protein